MLVLSLHEALQKGLDRVPALRDAVVLLKVWARQQALASESDSFSGFLLTAFAAHVACSGHLVRVNPKQKTRAP